MCLSLVNLLTHNDHYRRRTALLTSKRCILYIYSTHIGTEYFKLGMYSPCFPLQNAVCFINVTYLVPVLFTFHIQNVLKLKKNNSGAKRLITEIHGQQNVKKLHLPNLSPRLGTFFQFVFPLHSKWDIY